MSRLLAQGRLSLGARLLEVDLDATEAAIWLSGPSAGGKSSLLQALAGLRRFESGLIRAGEDLWQDEKNFLPSWRRNVGWAPQDALLFPHLSVRENVSFAAASEEAARRVAGELELEPILDRAPAALSGGERQRVALARALAKKPKWLLLDEPFSALDGAARGRALAAVKKLTQEWSLPFVLVTHAAEDASALASRRWEIADGRLSAR